MSATNAMDIMDLGNAFGMTAYECSELFIEIEKFLKNYVSEENLSLDSDNQLIIEALDKLVDSNSIWETFPSVKKSMENEVFKNQNNASLDYNSHLPYGSTSPEATMQNDEQDCPNGSKQVPGSTSSTNGSPRTIWVGFTDVKELPIKTVISVSINGVPVQTREPVAYGSTQEQVDSDGEHPERNAYNKINFLASDALTFSNQSLKTLLQSSPVIPQNSKSTQDKDGAKFPTSLTQTLEFDVPPKKKIPNVKKAKSQISIATDVPITDLNSLAPAAIRVSTRVRKTPNRYGEWTTLDKPSKKRRA